MESQAIAYYNIGDMYMTMDNYIQAEIYIHKSDSSAYITGDSSSIAGVRQSFGELYLRKKEYVKALQYTQSAENQPGKKSS